MKSYRNLQSNFGRLEHLLICTSCHEESQMLRSDPFKQAAGLGYFHLPTMENTSQADLQSESQLGFHYFLPMFASQTAPHSFCFRCECCSFQSPNIAQTLFYHNQHYCVLTSHLRLSAILLLLFLIMCTCTCTSVWGYVCISVAFLSVPTETERHRIP